MKRDDWGFKRRDFGSAFALPDADARAAILKALAHPVRLKIVYALGRGETCLCEIEPFLKIHPSNLSRHISQLTQAGIVSKRRIGQRVLLTLATPCILRALDCAAEVISRPTQNRRHAAKA